MDPDEKLKELRELARQVALSDVGSPTLFQSVVQLAESLAEKFEELDEWLQRGGFLPKAWQKSDVSPAIGQDGGDASHR